LKRVIIFSGKKERVKEINRSLKSMKINCDQMHSDLSQQERDEVMYRFKAGQTDVLVATDIVARGIDIDDIRTVINYDVPHDAEDYVHRIGRTARADRDGVAITFVSEADIYRFQQIEHFLGKEVEKVTLPDGLGESPEYTKREKKRSDTRRRGRWHSKGDGRNNQKSKGKKRHHPKKDGSTSNV
jgi:superfamily II DNA/RNA helicase